MNTFRSLVKFLVVTLVLAGAGAAGAWAQGLSTVNFAGTFTLPFEAQWGGMTLPAGDYTLQYGTRFGSYLVEIHGTAKGSPHGMIPVQKNGATSAPENSLVCMRASDTYVVTTLALPGIETTLDFSLPRGVGILAQKKSPKATAPVAQMRVPVQPMDR